MNELLQSPKDTSQSCIFDFPDCPGRPVPPIDPDNPPNPPLEYPYEPVLDWPPFPPIPVPGVDPIPGSNPHPYSFPIGLATIQDNEFYAFDYNDFPHAFDGDWVSGERLFSGTNYPGGGITKIHIPVSARYTARNSFPPIDEVGRLMKESGLLMSYLSDEPIFSSMAQSTWIYYSWWAHYFNPIDSSDNFRKVGPISFISDHESTPDRHVGVVDFHCYPAFSYDLIAPTDYRTPLIFSSSALEAFEKTIY